MSTGNNTCIISSYQNVETCWNRKETAVKPERNCRDGAHDRIEICSSNDFSDLPSYPLVNIQKAIRKWPLSSWIYPLIAWWIFPVRYVNVYQRVTPVINGISRLKWLNPQKSLDHHGLHGRPLMVELKIPRHGLQEHGFFGFQKLNGGLRILWILADVIPQAGHIWNMELSWWKSLQ